MTTEPISKPLRVALLGSRGVPARYGGYETLMEELGARLVELGVDVTVYCRRPYATAPEPLGADTRRHESYRGIHRVELPTIRTKHLDTPVHSLFSCLHACCRLGRRRYDAALMVNGANVFFVPLLRLAAIPTALHVDGIEQQRAKWGPLGRSVYALAERLARYVPTSLITDAQVIQRHYLEKYSADSSLIPYGVDPKPLPEGVWLDRLGLTSRSFILYVSRFEPENNPHRVVEQYRSVAGDLPLVMVGDAPYARPFIEQLKGSADARVVFPGAIYGDGYRELLSHALAYVHATEVGGTHPALVEALGYGNCVLVNDTPENQEVVGDSGLYFSFAGAPTLAQQLELVLSNHQQVQALRDNARQRAADRYTWDAVASQYHQLFLDLRG